MVARGGPPLSPPRTALSAVMSSTGNHRQLCSPSRGNLPDGRRRALPCKLPSIGSTARRWNKPADAYLSPCSWERTAILMTVQVTPPQEEMSCCFLGNRRDKRINAYRSVQLDMCVRRSRRCVCSPGQRMTANTSKDMLFYLCGFWSRSPSTAAAHHRRQRSSSSVGEKDCIKALF